MTGFDETFDFVVVGSGGGSMCAALVARAAGKSAAEIAKFSTEMNAMAEQYKNPLFRMALTFTEILPVALTRTVAASYSPTLAPKAPTNAEGAIPHASIHVESPRPRSLPLAALAARRFSNPAKSPMSISLSSVA